MTEIVADLRDDLIEALGSEDLADKAIETIRRWCAKEPVNDND